MDKNFSAQYFEFHLYSRKNAGENEKADEFLYR